jgi:stage III sporulation protein SpoIIIAA
MNQESQIIPPPSTIIDDIEALLAVLPPELAQRIDNHATLQEVVLDLGRQPTARYQGGEVLLATAALSAAELAAAVAQIGDFDADNRSGIERTLHRISAIRNRRGKVVGLTLRVGRAVYGTAEIIRDLIESGKSVLVLGRPGIGKTTILREAARVLAEQKRVVIVDTSNEIGGDGDIPHMAIGKARRMQVSNPSLQHEVMIEAVENHSPEVIVIDEIGRELEAAAARTIAERGVQLIGTAHGNTLDNILLNPVLADLVGGIESVTLSDEEARRRATQKTVLERRSPPTFDVLVEIQDRQRLIVHPDVAAAVDGILRGRPTASELRYKDESGVIQTEMQKAVTPIRSAQPTPGNWGQASMPWSGTPNPSGPKQSRTGSERSAPEARNKSNKGSVLNTVDNTALFSRDTANPSDVNAPEWSSELPELPVMRLFVYGIPAQRVDSVAKRIGLPVQVVDTLAQANAFATLRTYYRRRQRPVSDAEELGIPLYILRSSTSHQIQGFLLEIFGLANNRNQEEELWDSAIQETYNAIQTVLAGELNIDLAPQDAAIRRRQHQLAREAKLISHSYGKEPTRWVRIFRN